MSRIEGLVEKLMQIHQPGHCWSGNGRPRLDVCCGHDWPCPTIVALYEALDREPPPAQSTSRWYDGPSFFRGSLEVMVEFEEIDDLRAVVEERKTWTEEERTRFDIYIDSRPRLRERMEVLLRG